MIAYELELLDHAERLLSDEPIPTHNVNGLYGTGRNIVSLSVRFANKLNHERTTRKHKKTSTTRADYS